MFRISIATRGILSARESDLAEEPDGSSVSPRSWFHAGCYSLLLGSLLNKAFRRRRRRRSCLRHNVFSSTSGPKWGRRAACRGYFNKQSALFSTSRMLCLRGQRCHAALWGAPYGAFGRQHGRRSCSVSVPFCPIFRPGRTPGLRHWPRSAAAPRREQGTPFGHCASRRPSRRCIEGSV